ncbi:MAG TPA: DUF4476 domain-containing protein [Bacteroidales bacterium]|nr:DUF4476 domain-containing protein [Bacteroidales bacterium]
MKKFTLLLVLMAITPAMFAKAYSELTITINENADFYVVIDGRQYDSYAGSVVVSRIEHGRHGMEVFRESMTLNGIMVDRIFRGSVDIMPNKRMYGTIDRFGAFVILRSENMIPATGYSHGYGHNHSNGHGYGHSNHYGSSNGHYGTYSYGSNAYMPMGMSPDAFGMLLSSIRREAFDETRVRMAITAVSVSGVTSAQLRELMLMLTFDSNRLKLAKTAYTFVVDKGNIFMINDAFTFSSNADEFYRYIGVW